MSNKLQFGLVIDFFDLSFIFLLVYLIDCYLHWRHWITEDHSLSVTELGVHDGDVPQRDVLVDKVLVHVALHVVRELGPADAAGVQYSTVQYRLQNWLSVEIRCTEPDITVQCKFKKSVITELCRCREPVITVQYRFTGPVITVQCKF